MTVLAVDCGRPDVPVSLPLRPCNAGMETLLAGACAEVLMMSSRVAASRNPIGVIRPIDHQNLRRGVRYRLLEPDRARMAPGLAAQLGALALAGAVVKTVPEVPAEAVVIDNTVVVLPAGSGTAVFRLPSVITTVVELFERVWSEAVALAPADLPDTGELSARERKLLSLLVSGSTDTVTAAILDVSVRTVRRMVRDLMARLGARSRFQAGAKAAALGWLTDDLN